MTKAWVEIDCWTGLPVRVFENKKSMVQAMPYAEHGCTKEMDRAEAVRQIRQQRFSFQQGRCADCNCLIYWDTMHLENHLEVEKGGEVSLTNSVALCADCHAAAPADRQVMLGVESNLRRNHQAM